MKYLYVALLILFYSQTALANIVVIVHPENSNTLNKKMITKIFTGKSKTFPDGVKVSPIMLADGTGISDKFNKTVLNKSASQMKAYWSKLVFTGKGTPPKTIKNKQEVVSLVENNKNYIGFVDEESINSNVKVIFKF